MQPQLQTNSTLLTDDERNSVWYINLDDNEMSWVGSLTNLGALVGALSAGFFMDKFGRRFILMTMSLPYLLAWLQIAAAINPGIIELHWFTWASSKNKIF